MANDYLRAAEEELAAQQPRSRKKKESSGPDEGIAFDPNLLVHVIMLSGALALAGLAVTVCYFFLMNQFTVGRIIALPVGLVTAAAMSYASTLYCGIMEASSRKDLSVEEALKGGWEEWFWTLPMSLGMAALAAFFGYGVSLINPDMRWEIIGATTVPLYPVLQLSALENGTPLQPFSVPVVRTLASRGVVWLLFWGASVILFVLYTQIFRAAWRDPPYVTVLFMGPATAVTLLLYGWMLGRLAHAIGQEKKR